MTRLLAALAGASLLLTGPLGARAADLEFFTGESLSAQCSAKPADADYATRQGRCVGYVVGVSDAGQAAQGAGGPQKVCFPADVTAEKMVAAFNAFMAAHPEKRPLAAQDLVGEALAAQFACK
ncbi:MAG TPA: Rap1a/Tai family immunity protein [Caulobacteraceae bacterium]|jgi:hypothetical protein|nr:Rap1a/Tai family immunity protein [Caulobacteraceae bacterium]